MYLYSVVRQRFVRYSLGLGYLENFPSATTTYIVVHFVHPCERFIVFTIYFCCLLPILYVCLLQGDQKQSRAYLNVPASAAYAAGISLETGKSEAAALVALPAVLY